MRFPHFLLQRLGRVRQPQSQYVAADPANMGTEFALEASIVGWSDSFIGRDEAAAPAAPHDEPPLTWLGQPKTRQPNP